MGDQLAFIVEDKAGNSSVKLAELHQPQPSRREHLLDEVPWAKWYSQDDNHPIKVIEAVETNAQLASTLYWKANAIISGGLVYGFVNYDAEGREILQPTKDKKVEEFLKNSNIKRFLREEAHEFYHFWNCFPELVLNKARTEFVAMKNHESSFCRWKKKNDRGIIEECWIHPDFGSFAIDSNANNGIARPNGRNVNGQYADIKKIQAIHNDMDRVKRVRDARAMNWVFPVKGTSSGYVYYERAPWDALRRSKWLDISNQIAQFKLANLENQMQIKYWIKVPDWWFTEWKYEGKWKSMTHRQKQEAIKKEFDKFNDFLTGAKNSGKTIMTAFKTDINSRKEKWADWEIEEFKPNTLDAVYNDDSEISSNYISNGLGVHSSLVGTAPGKNSLGSKGSEIRNLFNIYISNSKPEQDILLEVLEFVRDYNQWDPNLQFWFKNYWLTTLDNVSTGDRNFNAGQ